MFFRLLKNPFSLSHLTGALIFMFLSFGAKAKTYTDFPELELRANLLKIQNADLLIDKVDFWVDSLNCEPETQIWQYLMLYKAEGLITKSDYAAAHQLIELIRKKAMAPDGQIDDPHLHFKILSQAANCHILLDDRPTGLDSLQKAITVAESNELYEDLAMGHVMIAEALRPTYMFPATTQHLRDAEQICIEHNLGPDLLAHVYDRFAACSVIHEMVIDFSQKAIKNAEEAENYSILGSAHLQWGMISSKPGHFRDSLLDVGAHYFRLLGDDRNLALAMFDKGKIYLSDNQVEEAHIYFDSTDYYRNGRDWSYLTLGNWYMKLEIYKRKDEKDSVIYYLEMINGWLGAKEANKNIQRLYFVEKKFQDELRSYTIREQDLMLEKGERRFKLIITFLIIAAVFVLVLIYFMVRLRRSKREIENKQKEIAVINSNLESSLEENKVLLYETHHRVKNNLQVVASLLELQSESSGNELLENALAGAQNRISAMAFVHELLYKQDDLKNVDLSVYLKAMSKQIALFYGGEENLNVNVECNNIQFPLHRAIHLGIFINELLTNSHKYARKKGQVLEIDIVLSEKRSSYRLTYRDNGPGLPNGLDSGRTGSIGLYLLKSMVKQLRGKLNYTAEEGSLFTIEFKR